MVVEYRPVVLADKTRPSKKDCTLRGKLYDQISCENCRTLLHVHTRTCMCGALFDLRVALWPFGLQDNARGLGNRPTQGEFLGCSQQIPLLSGKFGGGVSVQQSRALRKPSWRDPTHLPARNIPRVKVANLPPVYSAAPLRPLFLCPQSHAFVRLFPCHMPLCYPMPLWPQVLCPLRTVMIIACR